MNNEYKAKSNIDLYNKARELTKNFDFIKFEHIYRIENTVADKLANDSII